MNMGYAWLAHSFDAGDIFGDAIELASRAYADVVGDPIEVRSLCYDYYLGVADIDISDRMTDLKAIGFWPKIKDTAIPGSKFTIKSHQGIDGPGYQFNVYWGSDREAASTFLKALRDIDGTARFFNRDNIWYHLVTYGGSAPLPLNITTQIKVAVKLYLTDPYLYSAISQPWDVALGILPQTSEAMANFGHLDDGFETLAVTGIWDGAHSTEDVVLSVTGGDSMTLSDHLNSNEKITLGVDGSLVTEWTATLDSLATFTRDCAESVYCTFSGDHISIASNGYVVIGFYGPWPTKSAAKITANLTITGNALVQSFVDIGSPFFTAVATADIESGQTAIYFATGTEKAESFYLKFYCPAGATMQIHSLKVERILDCSGADLPCVPAGTSAAFTVSCDLTKSLWATIEGEYHPRREAI